MIESSTQDLVVLPTLKYANKMVFDCKSIECIVLAKKLIVFHENICTTKLTIHHQNLYTELEDIGYQTIIRHGEGEEVYIYYDSVNPINFNLAKEWLLKLHKYLRLANE